MKYGEDHCGIYMIINRTNGKVYIGQSRRMFFRKREHFDALKKHKHPNKDMQKDFNCKHIFEWHIVEYCNIEQLNEREKYWIDYYNSIEKGYNQTWVPYQRKPIKVAVKKPKKYHKTR